MSQRSPGLSSANNTLIVLGGIDYYKYMGIKNRFTIGKPIMVDIFP